MSRGDDRDERILSLLPLAHALVRESTRASVVNWKFYDDLLSEAMVGATKAVDAYDPARGTTLQGFAAHYVRGHILDALRTIHGVRRVSGELIRTKVETSPVEAQHLERVAADNPFKDAEDRVTVGRILDRLPRGVAVYLRDRFCRRVSLMQIAVAHGVVERSALNYERQALRDARAVADDPWLDLSFQEPPMWAARHELISPTLRGAEDA